MTTTKIDYKREYRQLYRARSEPVFVEIPELTFAVVSGHGDPNTSAAYAQAIEALYTLSYAAKFAVKQAGGDDFVVMPLEGLWWTDDMADFSTANKSAWNWTAMIMQPPEVTAEVFAQARTVATRKRDTEMLQRVRLEAFAEGRCAQILHVGPFAAEGPTIGRLHAFIAAGGCALRGHHHEIYLSDPRRAAPDKLRTIIRQPVSAA